MKRLVILFVSAFAMACLGTGTALAGPKPSALDPNLSLEEVAKKETKPLLVFFYADWCGYCQQAAPVVHELANKHKKKMKLVMVNADKPENRSLLAQFEVRGFPKIVVYKPKAKSQLQLRPPYVTGPTEFEKDLLAAIK